MTALEKLYNYFDYFCTIGLVTKEEEAEIEKCFKEVKQYGSTEL